ncbi:MAG: hypothetical protein ACOX6U_08090 [Oscillospiraceae bacterium]
MNHLKHITELCLCIVFLFLLASCTDPLASTLTVYEREWDSSIPKITIEAANIRVPCTAVKHEPFIETQTDREGLWFCSMVEQQECPINIPQGTLITIQFSETPDGEVTFVDHNLLDIGTENKRAGVSSFGRIYRETEPRFEELFAQNTKKFTADSSGKISFELWPHQYQMRETLMSSSQRLRGMQIQCTINGQSIEYYFIFTPYNK